MLKHKQGNLGEAAVQLELIKAGYEVYSPAFDNASSDMIVKKNGKLFMVEVKSCASTRRGRYRVQLRKVRASKNHNRIEYFDPNKVDILGVYIVPEDRVILIPSSEITVKTELVI